MNEQDVDIKLKPINGELVAIQLVQIPNLRKEIQDNVRSLVLRLDAHGKAISEGKSANLNILTLLQTQEKIIMEYEKRIKALENPTVQIKATAHTSEKFKNKGWRKWFEN